MCIRDSNNREIYEHALVLGHYERFNAGEIESEDLKPYCGLPMGGFKYRMHQMSSAVGLVQLKHYDDRCVEIRKAMNLSLIHIFYTSERSGGRVGSVRLCHTG